MTDEWVPDPAAFPNPDAYQAALERALVTQYLRIGRMVEEMDPDAITEAVRLMRLPTQEDYERSGIKPLPESDDFFSWPEEDKAEVRDSVTMWLKLWRRFGDDVEEATAFVAAGSRMGSYPEVDAVIPGIDGRRRLLALEDR